MRALLPLAAWAAAAQVAPRYTLRVTYDGKEKALVLYPGVEPADAAAAFVFDHAPRDAAASFESIVDHLCGRFACASWWLDGSNHDFDDGADLELA